jgi:AcrR family transcriptional regulator
METSSKKEQDLSTEEKIKEAARLVFHRKGFAATRTRDIADEAGINLALLNYYFRSKEKLFKIIMSESMATFVKSIAVVFNDVDSTLEQKIVLLSDKYISMLQENPSLPIFILGELQQNPDLLLDQFSIKQMVMNSSFLQQFNEAVQQGRVQAIHPLHFIMNLMSLIVFPFVASPMIKKLGELNQEQYKELMEQRKQRIPEWVQLMLFLPQKKV